LISERERGNVRRREQSAAFPPEKRATAYLAAVPNDDRCDCNELVIGRLFFRSAETIETLHAAFERHSE